MATLQHDTCRVDRETQCFADNVAIELSFEPPFYWVGTIIDPPNPYGVHEGQTYAITLSDGRIAKCILHKVANYMPGADIHYIPDDVETKTIWVFRGMESFKRHPCN